MYLEGYRITDVNGKTYSIKKHDFSADTIHTHRAYSLMENRLLNLGEDSFPVEIFDYDNKQFEGLKNNQRELLNWINNEKK